MGYARAATFNGESGDPLRPDWEIMEYSCEENNKDLREGHIKPWFPSKR